MSNSEAVELAKLMVSRQIRKEGKVPFEGFWNDVKWKRKFQEQIIAANALLKVYSYIAMINVLKTKEGSWQYSLRVKSLHELFEVEQKRLKKIEEKIEKVEEIKITESVDVQGKFGGKTNPLKGL